MPRFTTANAREMAARSAAKGRAAEAERIANPAPIPLPATPPADTDACVNTRLSRVRKQLDRLVELLSVARDPERIDRLASAQHRLVEQERILAGRPLRQPQARADEAPAEMLLRSYISKPLNFGRAGGMAP
jgi:hypothetical protein